ncbi:hypothetical protein GGR52DRAFT_135359 [Hypoxylon sp. FL1284]|nr:hypothetical protein GGR52DRAFT_135359 [Hypoxylon sp. FL1284]
MPNRPTAPYSTYAYVTYIAIYHTCIAIYHTCRSQICRIPAYTRHVHANVYVATTTCLVFYVRHLTGQIQVSAILPLASLLLSLTLIPLLFHLSVLAISSLSCPPLFLSSRLLRPDQKQAGQPRVHRSQLGPSQHISANLDSLPASLQSPPDRLTRLSLTPPYYLKSTTSYRPLMRMPQTLSIPTFQYR